MLRKMETKIEPDGFITVSVTVDAIDAGRLTQYLVDFPQQSVTIMPSAQTKVIHTKSKSQKRISNPINERYVVAEELRTKIRSAILSKAQPEYSHSTPEISQQVLNEEITAESGETKYKNFNRRLVEVHAQLEKELKGKFEGRWAQKTLRNKRRAKIKEFYFVPNSMQKFFVDQQLQQLGATPLVRS